jgi:hypothetical protein
MGFCFAFTLEGMNQPKNKGGRPPIPEDEKLIVSGLRLTRAQWEDFYALGGTTWLRQAIRRAKARKKSKKGPKAP